MNENIFNLIVSLIPVLGAILTSFLIPYIRVNINTARLGQYKEWARLAVKAADMLWKETGHGGDKKAYAVRFLDNLFNTNKTVVTKDQLDVLIEAAVKEMQEAGAQLFREAGDQL